MDLHKKKQKKQKKGGPSQLSLPFSKMLFLPFNIKIYILKPRNPSHAKNDIYNKAITIKQTIEKVFKKT